MTTETKRIPAERIEEWKEITEKDAAELATDAYDENDMEEFMLSSTEREFNAAAREALPALLSERESLLSLLREVEWGGKTMPVPDAAGDEWACPMCPICGRAPIQGHVSDCRLAAFLKET